MVGAEDIALWTETQGGGESTQTHIVRGQRSSMAERSANTTAEIRPVQVLHFEILNLYFTKDGQQFQFV